MTEVLNGYRIVSEWTTAGGGMCKWAFAERDGDEYFIKQFLRPTYPLVEGPGSKETKARKKKACESFERHHERLLASLSGLTGSGGHLIVTKDFFRVGAKYYKVTDRVETTSLSIPDIAKIEPPRKRVILALTIAHSLEILHRKGIVHGDLKPANILPKLTAKGVFVAKLIDFDDSYRVGEPPPPGEVVGDLSYYSPELLRYVQYEGDGAELGCPSDIFALGIVLCQYFQGELPAVSSEGHEGKHTVSIAEAVARGQELRTGLEESWPDMDALLRSMLQLRPESRPTIAEVAQSLKVIRDLETKGARTRPPTAERAKLRSVTGEATASASGLKGKGLSIGYGSTGSVFGSARISEVRTTTGPTLRGKLVRLPEDST